MTFYREDVDHRDPTDAEIAANGWHCKRCVIIQTARDGSGREWPLHNHWAHCEDWDPNEPIPIYLPRLEDIRP